MTIEDQNVLEVGSEVSDTNERLEVLESNTELSPPPAPPLLSSPSIYSPRMKPTELETHEYDPREFIRGFQQILTSNSKKLGFLAGAGVSMSVRRLGSNDPIIPGVWQMTSIIEEKLDLPYKEAYIAIKMEAVDEGESPQIENILSRVRLKAQVAGNDVLCGLTKTQLFELEAMICSHIREIVSPSEELIPDGSEFAHQQFAKWICHAHRQYPVEIFTTNYDYLFEIALEREGVAYFDGFTGSHQPFFNAPLVEQDELIPSNWVRLWKLHGSLGWKIDKNRKTIIRDSVSNKDEIMVYPSVLKYDDSRKQPYVSLIDRLGAFLRKEDSVLIVCGYSFGDQHLNETILNALARTRTSNAIIFTYSDITESDHLVQLAQKEPRLTVFAPKAAVIGGKFGVWRLQREPSMYVSIQVDAYFDEDFPEDCDGKLLWTGDGRLILGDFHNFVKFIQMMVTHASMFEVR